jgi:hypothetical protein
MKKSPSNCWSRLLAISQDIRKIIGLTHALEQGSQTRGPPGLFNFNSNRNSNILF